MKLDHVYDIQTLLMEHGQKKVAFGCLAIRLQIIYLYIAVI